MQTWSLPRWVLPAALTGMVAIAAIDAVMLRKNPVHEPAAPPVFEHIGLAAAPDGDAIQLQWNRHGQPVRDAERAIVYIQDGKYKSRLDLTRQQLNSSSIRYWPESNAVTFSMELHSSVHGGAPQPDPWPPFSARGLVVDAHQ
jgi:hypothetical protein